MIYLKLSVIGKREIFPYGFQAGLYYSLNGIAKKLFTEPLTDSRFTAVDFLVIYLIGSVSFCL